jgi:hypothetical protein
MIPPEADLHRRLMAAFQMPSVQTMVSRKSSITNAFVNAVIPTIMPSVQEIGEALAILGMAPDNVRCAYCGDKSTEWDHLRPLVRGRRPTGFISEIANLVPACGKCNQSKGNKPWRDWLVSDARLSPKGRGVNGIEQRIAALERYEQWKSPTQIDFGLTLGTEDWERYWLLCDAVNEELRRAQDVALALRSRIAKALIGNL